VVDERSRLLLADAVKQALGDDAGITLMELLPPVGWADVATKHDLLALEARMDARFETVSVRLEGLDGRMAGVESELRAQTWKLMTLMVAVVGVVVAAVRL
jgi:hypothetical protein